MAISDRGRSTPGPVYDPNSLTYDIRDIWMRQTLAGNGINAPHPNYGSSNFELDISFPWYAQASSNAELLDAAGGIMIHRLSEDPVPYPETGQWMPG